MARYVSDGTMKLLAYLLVLYDPEPPPFVAIEEPENFVHPALLRTLAEECMSVVIRSQFLVRLTLPSFSTLLKRDKSECWFVKQMASRPCGVLTVFVGSPSICLQVDYLAVPGSSKCSNGKTSCHMHVEILVEEPSAAVAIETLLRRLGNQSQQATERIVSFRGKDRMLQRLEPTLRSIVLAGYASSVIVLIDQDAEDCLELKGRIYSIAEQAGIPSALTSMWVRIAVVELESWFLGDPLAIRSAYPAVTAGDVRTLKGSMADSVRDPSGWLQKKLNRRRHYEGGMPKIEVARNIAAHLNLDPNHNTSRSFRLFLRTLREVYGLPTDALSSRSPSM